MSSNTVELLGYYGGDKTHSLSAWTSTFAELNIEIPKYIPDRIDAIFNYVTKLKKKTPLELITGLAEAGHHTPFEKSCLHFMVNSEIATHIQLLKHRIGVSINGESARYKELLEDKYYLPRDWKGIVNANSKFNRIFNYHEEDSRNPSFSAPDEQPEWFKLLEDYTKLGNDLYHECLKDLTPILGRKRAKESARFFRGYNSQITVDIMFNFRSFMHFMQLRNSEHAQVEVREVAQTMLALIKDIPNEPFGFSLKAFGY